jgi:hypothetical protein
MSKDKRIVVLADLHCGSIVGLTHPDSCKLSKHDKDLKAVNKAVWDFFSTSIRSLGKIDYLVVNGDSIDGKASKNGGNDVMTTCLTEQVDMASRAIKYCQASKILIVGGTEYHTRENGEDFEEILARQLEATYTLGGHFRFKFDDFECPTVFNFKHFMGGRNTLTRVSSLKRVSLAEAIQVFKQDKDMSSDVTIRSHIHVFDFCKGIRDNTLDISSPALQAPGTTYGKLKCDGEYSLGFLEFIVNEKGLKSWKPIIAKIPSLQSKVLSI